MENAVSADAPRESALARILRPRYSLGDDEAPARTRSVHVDRHDTRRSEALATVCAEVTDTHIRHPGTDPAPTLGNNISYTRSMRSAWFLMN